MFDEKAEHKKNDKLRKINEMENTIAGDNDKIVRKCSKCGELYTVDFLTSDFIGFCSEKCATSSEYAYIRIDVDGSVSVVKCDSMFNIHNEIERSIGLNYSECESCEFVREYMVRPVAVATREMPSEPIKRELWNEIASKSFDWCAVGTVIIANYNGGLTPLAYSVAEILAKEIKEKADKVTLKVPDFYPSVVDTDE